MVDDGSTDGTAEAVEREFSVFREQFSASHKPSSVFSVPSVVKPSLWVIRQQNAGPGAARNRGLAEATGEFIHFFDSDDIASPNKHEVQLKALLETGANIAYGPWVKGRFGNLTTEDTENTEEEAVLRLGKPSGAAFSNPFTSELARDCENASPTRSASALACVLFADHGEIGSAGGNQLADSKEFLEGQLQAGLEMDNQKGPTIRIANDPGASGEYSSSDLRQPLGASPCGPTSGCSSSRLPERSVVPI